ncbi:uncharacterized protein LOC117505461 [Thalassophryne amazonica]|uniref:uncharacterized protein LOC117505461 n=1 Tax=Thalassophryne amazonica TaxID=390379 RepID=UPI001470FBCD|nr:uncharacterized protein LOC117505461 [Thalassophryne amazonica]
MFELLNLLVLGFHFLNVQTGKEHRVDVKCYIRSYKLTQCVWNLPISPDIRLFYWLINEDENLTTPSPHFQECSSYVSIDTRSTMCDMQRNYRQSMPIKLKWNETVIKNPTIPALSIMSPPPMNWTYIVKGNRANIMWTPPDFGDDQLFTYTLSYTHCGEKTEITHLTNVTYQLTLDSACNYCMVIKPVYQYLGGKTYWSDEKCFGVNITVADGESKLKTYVIVFISVVSALLAALTFLCLWKNKDKIFPKIPEPRDYFTDVLNNNKMTVVDWCMPVEEEENCKISLVADHKVDS